MNESTPKRDNLSELRAAWEGSGEPVTELALPGALLVVIKYRRHALHTKRKLGKYAYSCLRYFPLPAEWVVSCDHREVDAEEAIKWLAEQVPLQL